MGSILLVETDPDVAELWSSALDDAGHAVLTAAALEAAPGHVREGGIDAVIIDCYDPCLGVMEVARDIDTVPDAPPIILVSNSPTAPEISARIGAAVFLPKPCEPAEIVAAVTRLVGELRPVRIVDDEPTGRRTQLG